MKCTVCLTLQCNLACPYCYMPSSTSVISDAVAEKAVEYIYRQAPPGETIEVGLFGGEPLLVFERVRFITELIESNPDFSGEVRISVVTNGTILSEEILRYVGEHSIAFRISCDGPPEVQDQFRRTRSGQPSSTIVEKTIRKAVQSLPAVLVNAVYGPQTIGALPISLDYLASLGVKNIYLSPDYRATWTAKDCTQLPAIYKAVADRYIEYHRKGDPRFISLIEGKIAVFLNGGYWPEDHCRMGQEKFAIAPDGSLYPCERLMGNPEHCIGHIDYGVSSTGGCTQRKEPSPCQGCGISKYCMHWCGYSNYFSTDSYDKAGSFACASEKEAISAALYAYEVLSKELGSQYLMQLVNQPRAKRLGASKALPV